jgi:hypothetical protein
MTAPIPGVLNVPTIMHSFERGSNVAPSDLHKLTKRRKPMVDTVSKKPLPSGATETEKDLKERIRSRAYELYEARGRKDGHDVEDWVHAEQDVMRRAYRVAA